MGAIRKFPHPDRRQSFRSRLQRALSLSSSESEGHRSPSRSAADDTTEEEEYHQEENDFPSHQRGDSPVGSIEEDAPHDWNTGRDLQKELEIPRQSDVSGNCNMIAFQCIAELDTRMKSVMLPSEAKYIANIIFRSLQNSLSNQTNWNETIRSDLEEIRSRLAVVEAAIEMTAKEEKNTTVEGKTTGRRRRS
ncbi:uncharacterized protein N7498_001634 [Penicillium cinerascens]|uniref:Uncharacterized protein n=1 Tax=Penicillium cinerascens TaxID=70096 RepID=A0A9W9N8M9_9EURO|nr:uncharacterized protein N7498_001634 [Penicillium cinerascens]KAJ5215227.1 hypothetical protein N7498_001634 [Penicillium cinerascens]